MDFEHLVSQINSLHAQIASQASKAVNVLLTCRNWLIGLQIKEYELRGSDRIQYGSSLYETLADRLEKGLGDYYTPRYLQLCRQFYEVYPQIAKSLISQSNVLSPSAKSLISQSVAARALRSIDDRSAALGIPPEVLLSSLSFTHFVELVKIDDPLNRLFVSKYQLALPNEAEMRAFVEERLKEERPLPEEEIPAKRRRERRSGEEPSAKKPRR